MRLFRALNHEFATLAGLRRFATAVVATYLASHDQTERKNLAYEIQRAMLENYYFVPVFRHAFVNAIGPRIAAKQWQDVFPTYITSGYAYPWEDIELKETAAAEK